MACAAVPMVYGEDTYPFSFASDDGSGTVSCECALAPSTSDDEIYSVNNYGWFPELLQDSSTSSIYVTYASVAHLPKPHSHNKDKIFTSDVLADPVNYRHEVSYAEHYANILKQTFLQS